jgi:hypothetical protein
MNTCGHVNTQMHDLASRPPARLPAEIAGHLDVYPACRRALAVARVTRGLLAVLPEVPESPPVFVDRVPGALPVVHLAAPVPVDLWRPAWGLFPAFTSLVLGIFQLYQAVPPPDVPGLLPTDDLSASERLVLGPSAPRSRTSH